MLHLIQFATQFMHLPVSFLMLFGAVVDLKATRTTVGSITGTNDTFILVHCDFSNEQGSQLSDTVLNFDYVQILSAKCRGVAFFSKKPEIKFSLLSMMQVAID